jgi:YVTN family beta-propeller protein
MAVEIRLLGALEVVDEQGRRLEIPGAKERSLLVLLALRGGQPVSRDRLIEALWPRTEPESAARSFRVRMANLRRALGGELVGRSGGGYALAVPGDQVDALCFETLLGDGRPVQALALWRGEPLAGIEGEWAEGERRRLRDLHLEAREKSLAAQLEAGGGGELVGQLQTLVVDEPLRERPRELLMRALYRAGRQADALEVYRQTRSLFDTELGIEPSPQLRQLERSILTHDSGLAAPAQDRKRRWLLLAVPAIVLAAGSLSVLATHDPTPVYHAPANSAVRIDPRSGHVSRATVVGRLPEAVAFGAGSVWIANRGDDTISRLDRSGRASAVVPLDAQPTALAFADGWLWATTGTAGELLKIDPASSRVSKTLGLAAEPLHPYSGHTPVAAITAGAGGIWVGGFRLQKFAGARRLVTRPLGTVSGLAAADGFVWAVDTFSGLLTQVDSAGHIARQISVGANSANGKEQVYGITAIVACRGSLWLTDPGGDRIWNVDPGSTRIADAVAVPGRPTGIACDGRDIWVTSIGNDTVSEIDTTSAHAIRTIHLDRTPAGIAANPKDVWVSVD